MSGYRKEWPCCGDETYTEAWEPERCPFCELNDAQDRIAELETELEAARAQQSGEGREAWREVVQRAVDELSIMDESEGIAGFHLNGDVSPWSEGELPAVRDELQALLSNIPPADKPEGEWVKCSERLPTEDDVDFEYRLWCWFPERGDMKLLLLDQIIQAHMSGIAVLWTTTNLKRPAAPDMGGEW